MSTSCRSSYVHAAAVSPPVVAPTSMPPPSRWRIPKCQRKAPVLSTSCRSSYVHAAAVSLENPEMPEEGPGALQVAVAVDVEAQQAPPPEDDAVNYMARAQWLRAAVLCANDGLVSVASLMVGVGAVNQNAKTMVVSGLAGLVAGACSMAIGELVSLHAQYDIEVAEMERRALEAEGGSREREELPKPLLAAGASALAFAIGAALPLLGGAFVKSWGVRVGVVCAVSSLGLVGFGAAGAVLGGAKLGRSAARVLIGGWLAMLVTYGVLRAFVAVFNMPVSSA